MGFAAEKLVVCAVQLCQCWRRSCAALAAAVAVEEKFGLFAGALMLCNLHRSQVVSFAHRLQSMSVVVVVAAASLNSDLFCKPFLKTTTSIKLSDKIKQLQEVY